MPPRISLQPIGRRSSIYLKSQATERNSVCFFCSLSGRSSAEPSRRPRPRRKSQNPRRFASTTTNNTTSTTSTDHNVLEPRRELEETLLELEKHAPNYINLSRLQLALNGLRQRPGDESIRVAVLGLSNGSESSEVAKQVLRLLLADPLKAEEEWEKEVAKHDLTQPMIIRVGAELPKELESISVASKESSLHEVNVSSATLNGHNLELLLMETNPFLSAQEIGALKGSEESVLVPTVDIPTSDTGRHTPITTPVHKALIVAEGLLGAASVVSMSPLENQSVITAAVNLPEYKLSADTSPLPFTPIDIGVASIGLGLVRKDLKNAIEFEHLWFQSNIPKLVDWLKTDIMASDEGTTKPPVKDLIDSLLRNTSAAIENEEARQFGSSLSPTTPTSLQSSLDDWAESAHTELQEQLDIAFSSKRWRKLGWWKLFWRADDVGMLTNDILSQRFLLASERNAIFLAGRMKESGIALGPFPNPYTTDENGAESKQLETQAPTPATAPWPVSIPTTRRYLQTKTIPALQALSQKLIVQTLGTSGLTTALGALIYLSTLTATLYEAGAVAALGIVWSMRRMQKQWETARTFWEGEVREEGRKAVRDVEGVVGDALKQGRAPKDEAEGQDSLTRAKGLVKRAQEILSKLK
ncbi:uncharacterized protein GGS22DRAFT_75339 [Annulohypoxylon maeteangense]|uniref:uncharacterized protein n=1 Tax=Annulohypoxylon maeteangense TaxID=1927788 RepID=UPI00200759E0|nr:uncharacterized protein GGS22DRAFT_75339 [Annulohypoxylon maeteangense]KAI0881074.1 hypothetical protein GGS22DRAFT_75339 [Annulohypoxylon maeteangense]